MSVNVEAVLIVSGMIFATCMGGLATALVMFRRNDRQFHEEMDRIRADRG